MSSSQPRPVTVSASFVVLAAVLAGTVIATPLSAARQVRKVSGAAVSGSDVAFPNVSSRQRISPDGEWIAWVQDAEVNNAHALWVARRSGGPPKRLSGTLPPGSVFNDIQFSPDSQYLVYTAEQETVDRYDLYTVPLLGTAADGVKRTPPGATNAFNVSFTGDGQRLVFQSFALSSSGHSLFSVPLAGSAGAIGLDGPFAGDGGTDEFAVVGNIVVFTRQETQNGVEELWRVPAAGPATAKVRLTPPFSGNRGVNSFSLEISSDGLRCAFLADDDGSLRDELWTVVIGGPAESAVKLVDNSIPGGGIATRLDFTPDGTRIVFRGDLDVDGQQELYSVSSDGSSPPVKLSTGLIPAGDVTASSVSLDGTFVVYVADWAIDGRGELFRVPIAGPSAAGFRLNRPLSAGEAVLSAVAREDHILYFVTIGGILRELRGVPLGGPASAEWPIIVAMTELRPPSAFLEDHTVVTGDPISSGVFELWSAPNDGSAVPNSLFNPIWGSVTLGASAAATPDESEVFFLAALSGGRRHVWSTRSDGSQVAPQRLSPAATVGNVVDQPFEITPDGRGVLFEGDLEVSTREELFLADETRIFAADFETGDLSQWSP